MDYIGNRDLIIEYNKAIHKITEDLTFLKATYLQARTDNIRQKIIDGINNGTIKTESDVLNITITMAPGYEYIKEQELI